MRLVPRWALLPSMSAPVLLIAGWTGAALLEGPAYDPARQTISVLATYGAPGFWVMSGALLALGLCHLLTAWGLRAAALAGRVALGGGGLAAFAVVLLPAPSSGGSLRHGSVAVVGFTLLAVWPVLAADRSTEAPWGLRPVPSWAATSVMGAGALWFVFESNDNGAAGVAERFVTSFQSLWPLVVVLSCLRHPGSRSDGNAGHPTGYAGDDPR
ncbi:DUF998 domain-containing protein [Streptomyces heilongjiangensis]|nr:DUF998 domain-containing protein [Streptomyces heilongjiangensis]MDC2946304.1 DUF998 domain-containing protein [Streptomyces heilongjiangensis]